MVFLNLVDVRFLSDETKAQLDRIIGLERIDCVVVRSDNRWEVIGHNGRVIALLNVDPYTERVRVEERF